MGDIQQLKEKPYLCSPRPRGARFLLFVNPEGHMFMEHQDRHIYKVAQDRAPQRIPNDTILFGMIVRKVLRDEATLNSNPEAKGKLMFVILDATRVSGADLTEKSLLARICAVQVKLDGFKMVEFVKNCNSIINLIERNYGAALGGHKKQKDVHRR